MESSDEGDTRGLKSHLNYPRGIQIVKEGLENDARRTVGHTKAERYVEGQKKRHVSKVTHVLGGSEVL